MSVTRTVYVVESSADLAESLCYAHDWGDDLRVVWAGDFRAIHEGLVLGHVSSRDSLFEGTVIFETVVRRARFAGDACECGHSRAIHQTGTGPWTGFCGDHECECEEPR